MLLSNKSLWSYLIVDMYKKKILETIAFPFYFARHEYAVAEKNTVIATCRKLEEQLEDRGKQIQQ